ncbi:MAG TPA: rhomboid family intramembrane serine protease [Burkholderiales bacterium]|nr:rhomboid family intramembrane serine protease [Burkholderiales bacterium]
MPSYLNLTRILIILNVVFYGIERAIPELTIVNFALWPLNSGAAGNPPFEVWQLITYAFLHDPDHLTHILLNMWALFIFGPDVERVLGIKRYAGLYFTSVLTAGLTQMAFSYFAALSGYTVGASGAVFGVLLAFAVFFPKRIIVLIIPPIPLPARIFVVLYAALELYLGVTGTQEGVAHFAHLGGLVGALFFLRLRRS